MAEIPDGVVLDGEVTLVDGRDEGQPVHVLEHRPIGRTGDAAIVAVREPGDARERPPRAISCTVRSNSPRATQSTAGLLRIEASGATATAAPTMPIDRPGFSAFNAAATFTSAAKDGVLVCITQRS